MEQYTVAHVPYGIGATARRTSAGLIGLGLLVCSPAWSMVEQAYRGGRHNDANSAPRAGADQPRALAASLQAQRQCGPPSRNYNDLEKQEPGLSGPATQTGEPVLQRQPGHSRCANC
jgi:hypothetical protein